MEPKKRRKAKGTVIIGRGAATVRIYPITRKDGYLQNTVCWKEGGRRRTWTRNPIRPAVTSAS